MTFGKHASGPEIVGWLIAWGGANFLVQGKRLGLFNTGLLAMLGATLSWSLGTVLQTSQLPLTPEPQGYASEILCGGAVLLVISLAVGEKIF